MKNLKNLLLGQLLLIITAVLLFSSNARATVFTLDLALSGQNEVPANATTASGILTGTYDDASNVLSFSLMFNGLIGTTTAAHFHGPATPEENGPVVIGLVGFPAGVTSGSYSNSFVLTQDMEAQLLCGLWYINIHTSVYPGGEIRSQLKEGTTTGTVATYGLNLEGQQEVPPNASPATGTFIGTYNDVTNTLSFDVNFNGLVGTTTAAHFHGPAPAGVNGPVVIGFIGFPAGVTSGTYSNSYVLTSDMESQLLSGLWYINIHTSVYPGGEIRSQLLEATATGTVSTLELALTGQKEVPPNVTTATGTMIGTYDDATNTLSFDVNFNGLVGITTAAHFHAPAAAGVNGPVVIGLAGFPVGVTSGTYSNSYVLTPEMETQLHTGLMYLNIHTNTYPGGEIRSQLAEGTLTGECLPPPSTIPVANWAIVLGALLIGVYAFYMIRRRF